MTNGERQRKGAWLFLFRRETAVGSSIVSFRGPLLCCPLSLLLAPQAHQLSIDGEKLREAIAPSSPLLCERLQGGHGGGRDEQHLLLALDAVGQSPHGVAVA